MGILDSMKRAVILQKPSGTIAIGGNLDIRERKFYNVFLKVAEEVLKKSPQQHIFITTLTELKKAINVKEDDKNNTTLKKIIKRMHEIDFEYNVLNKDKMIEGYASLIDNVKFVTDLATGSVTISYSLPEDVRLSMVEKNGIYASINLIVVKGLRSKYSVVLYELIRDYNKVEVPQMDIGKFRKIFGVENKYKEMANLRKRVLDSAVNELNENENIDFFVSYKLQKTGKAYTHIKFHIKPKPKVLKLKQQANKILESTVKENEEIKELLLMIPSEYRRKEKVVSLLLGSIETKGKEYTKAQIEYTVSKFNSGKVKDFVAYLKQAIEKDYAAVEELELGPDVVKPDDAVGYEGESIGKPETKIRILSVEEKEDEEIYIVSVKNMNTDEVVWVEVEHDRIIEYAKKNIEMKKKRSMLIL